jgi:hypothetical protein
MSTTKRSAYDRAKDNKTSDDGGYAIGYTQDQVCSAKGCPSRWAVDAGKGRLCSAHHSVDDMPHLWPQITQQELDMEAMRVQRAQRPKQHPAAPLSRADKIAILNDMRSAVQSFGKPTSDRAWAEALRDRDRDGARLTPAQRTMYRQVLGSAA